MPAPGPQVAPARKPTEARVARAGWPRQVAFGAALAVASGIAAVAFLVMAPPGTSAADQGASAAGGNGLAGPGLPLQDPSGAAGDPGNATADPSPPLPALPDLPQP